MKVCLTSDSHYGFSELTEELLQETLENIANENPDILLHAGDWASTTLAEFEACVKLFRKHLPKTVIVGALGNHDLWDVNSKNKMDTVSDHFRKLNAIFLNNNILSSYINFKESISFTAMQSWYKSANPPSNDKFYMPDGAQAHVAMISEARISYGKTLEHLKQLPDFKHVVISHFTPYNYRYGYTSMCGPLAPFDDLISENAHTICLGHSHEHQNEKILNTSVLNAGADYNDPKFIMFEVG